METLELTYNENAQVVQANELIRSRQEDFTLLEAKLIRLAISQVVMNDIDFHTYTCRIPELAAFLGIPQDNIYRDIDSATTGLMKKVIKIVDKSKPLKRNGQPNYHKFQWVSECKYENGILTIELHKALKPYLLGLDKLFTMYGLDSILNLPTSNAIRLFELLTSYESMINVYSPTFTPYNPFPQIQKQDNELIFSIDYLRQYFNCTDKYPLTADFIKRIIEPSAKGINKNTIMRTSYRLVKEGRKVAYVLFKINAWNDSDFMEYIQKCLD